jgi:hypothetical protein
MWKDFSMRATQFTTKEQLKYFVFESHVPNYIKKRFVILCSHIQIHVPFWNEFKKTYPNGET